MVPRTEKSAGNPFRRIGQYLLYLIFPAKCIFCRQPLPYDTASPCCPRCLLTHRIGRARKLEIPAGVCHYALRYRGEVRRAVLAFKFHNTPQYAQPLGTLLADSLSLLSGIDCITYVPVSAMRLARRGYDQSKLLAEAVGKTLSLPVIPLLRKTRHTRPQSRTPGIRRAAHVRGVYALAGKQNLSGKTILLIDDVVTTGSTISECAGVLMAHGAYRVICAALAHGE